MAQGGATYIFPQTQLKPQPTGSVYELITNPLTGKWTPTVKTGGGSGGTAATTTMTPIAPTSTKIGINAGNVQLAMDSIATAIKTVDRLISNTTLDIAKLDNLDKAISNNNSIIINMIGDSNFDFEQFNHTEIVKNLTKTKASGGIGFINPFGNIAASLDYYSPPVGVSITQTGAWVNQNLIDNNAEIESLAGKQIIATSAAATAITTTATAITDFEKVSTIKIYAFGNGAAFRYNINGGSWTTITTTNSSALNITSITGLSNTALTLNIEWVSGTLKLYGYSFKNSNTNALIINKLGHGRARTELWKTVTTKSIYQEMLTDVAATSTMLMLGTNDKGNDILPATFKTDLTSISSNLYKPTTDLVLVAPLEHIGTYGTVYDMKLYRDEIFNLASTNKYGYLSMYDKWGSYTESATQGVLNGDGIHISPTGAIKNGYILYDFLFKKQQSTSTTYFTNNAGVLENSVGTRLKILGAATESPYWNQATGSFGTSSKYIYLGYSTTEDVGIIGAVESGVANKGIRFLGNLEVVASSPFAGNLKTSGLTQMATNGNVTFGNAQSRETIDFLSAHNTVQDGAISGVATQGGFFTLRGATTRLVFKHLGAAPFTWQIQNKHQTVDAAYYPISINALGGNVGVGTINPLNTLQIGTPTIAGTTGIRVITSNTSFLKTDANGDIIAGKEYRFVANTTGVTAVDVTAASPSNGTLVQGSSALLSADLTGAATTPGFTVTINGSDYNVKSAVVATATTVSEGYVVFTGNSLSAYNSNLGSPNTAITINTIHITK